MARFIIDPPHSKNHPRGEKTFEKIMPTSIGITKDLVLEVLDKCKGSQIANVRSNQADKDY